MADPQFAPIGDNKPPLVEVAKVDIAEALRAHQPRLDELLGSVDKASCDTEENAGKVADLGKLLGKLRKRIETTKNDVKEPYKEAGDVIQAAGNAMFKPIDDAVNKLRAMATAFAATQREAAAKAAREQAARDAEERERVATAEREEQQRAAAAGYTIVEDDFLPPLPTVAELPRAAPRTAPPIATGDYGAKATATVRKVPSIVDVYALPIDILGAPKVTDAILSVVRAMRVGNPDLEIKGIELVDDHSVSFR